MPGNLSRAQIKFGGGLNNKFAEFNIRDNESSDLLNCVLADNNTIEKRQGYTLEGDDTGSTKILGIHAHYESGGTKELLRSTDTNFQYLVGTTWTNIDTGFTTGLETNYVTANDKTYIFNGTDNVHSYTGAGAALTDLGAGMPKGKFSVWWNEILVTAGVSGSEDTLYFSALHLPEDHTDNYTDDLDLEITGIGVLGYQLVVFSEKKIWIYTGSNPTSLSKNEVDQAIGSVNHRSIQAIAGAYLLFQDADGNVQRLVGSRVEDRAVSYPIETSIKALKGTLLNESAAWFFDNKYHLAVAGSSSSTFNDMVLVYDVVRRAWTIFDGVQASCFATFKDNNVSELFFGEADADSKVYELYQGASDNATAIDFFYTTKSFDMNTPQVEKKFKLFYINILALGDYDITIEYSIDGGPFATLGTINLSNDGLILDTSTLPALLNTGGLVEQNTLIIPNRGRSIKFRFSNNAAGEDIKIFNAECWYRPKRIRKRLQSTI